MFMTLQSDEVDGALWFGKEDVEKWLKKEDGEIDGIIPSDSEGRAERTTFRIR